MEFIFVPLINSDEFKIWCFENKLKQNESSYDKYKNYLAEYCKKNNINIIWSGSSIEWILGAK